MCLWSPLGDMERDIKQLNDKKAIQWNEAIETSNPNILKLVKCSFLIQSEILISVRGRFMISWNIIRFVINSL